MKSICTVIIAILLVACGDHSFCQTLVFSENMGTPSSTTAVNSYTGWQNNSTLSYSADANTEVRTTSASTGYTGASGSGNVLMATAVTSNRFFQISGINTTSLTGLTLSFGLFRDNLTNGLTVEVSTNGTTYTSLSITQPPSASTWTLVTATGTIPATANLRIRFSKNNSTSFRVDDVKLTAATLPTLATTSATGITDLSFSSGGTISSDGGAAVTAKGIVWGTSANPTISSNNTNDGSGTAAYTSSPSSLTPNTLYFYRAYATNSVGTAYGSESSVRTLASIPSAPSVSATSTSSINIVLNSDANPSTTEYAIWETSSGSWLQDDGSLGASPLWQSRSAWSGAVLEGLDANTSHGFQVKARNDAGAESSFSAVQSAYTHAAIPGKPTAWVNAGGILLTLDLNGNPASTEFAIEESQTGKYIQNDGKPGAAPFWQTASGWTSTIAVSGLAVSFYYSFQVKARNGDLVATSFGDTAQASLPVQASNLSFLAVTSGGIKLSFDRGNGSGGVIVLVTEGDPVTATPIDGMSYAAPCSSKVVYEPTLPVLGNANTVFKVSNAFPAPASFTLKGVKPFRRYYFAVYEYDSSSNGTVYTQPPLLADTITLTGPPTSISSNLRFEDVTSTGLRIRWKNGNGTSRIVIMKAGANVTAHPEDLTAYQANSAFGAGDSVARPIGTNFTGTQYVVYSGTDSTAVVTGLLPFTEYSVSVYEFNGSGENLSYSVNGRAGTMRTNGVQLAGIGVRSLNVNFCLNSGRGAVVFVKEGAPIVTHPQNGVSYTAPYRPAAVSFMNDSLSSLDGAKLVYKNGQTGTSVKTFSLNNLNSQVAYYVAVYEWDSLGNVYFPSSRLLADTVTLLGPPTIAASNVRTEDVGANSFKIKWKNGNGNRRIVVVKSGSALKATPQENVLYAASALFGMGDTLALGPTTTNDGRHYVVYDGSDSSVLVTNLLSNTTYYLSVFEYNGTLSPKYMAGSPGVSRKTAIDYIDMNVAGQPSAQNFNSMQSSGSLPQGWHATVTTIQPNDGSDSAQGMFHFGGGNYPDSNRSLGSIGACHFGVKLRNNTGKTVTSILVKYTGLQWRKGGQSGSSIPDGLAAKFSLNAYSFNQFNKYNSPLPATWTPAASNTWNNNTDLDFHSLITGAGAGSLNSASGPVPSESRQASLINISLLPGEFIWLRFDHPSNPGGNSDALAIDDVEIVPFSNTYIASGSPSQLSSSNLNDANILGDAILNTSSNGTATITNALNLEAHAGAGSTELSFSNRTLVLQGKVYGAGALLPGGGANLTIYGAGLNQTVNFSSSGNSVLKNLTLGAGASVSVNGKLSIAGGTQAGTVRIGAAGQPGQMNIRDSLVLKSLSGGDASIGTSYGTINGKVVMERYIGSGGSAAASARWRMLSHPFNESLPLSQLEGDDASSPFHVSLPVYAPSGLLQAPGNVQYHNSASDTAGLITNLTWTDVTTLDGSGVGNAWAPSKVIRVKAQTHTLDISGTLTLGSKDITLTAGARHLFL